MSLLTRLRLSVSAINRVLVLAPQLQTDGFDVLLTSSGDAILTQSGIFIVRHPEQYDIILSGGITLNSQDGRTLQARF